MAKKNAIEDLLYEEDYYSYEDDYIEDEYIEEDIYEYEEENVEEVEENDGEI